jgi:hypothetical protein
MLNPQGWKRIKGGFFGERRERKKRVRGSMERVYGADSRVWSSLCVCVQKGADDNAAANDFNAANCLQAEERQGTRHLFSLSHTLWLRLHCLLRAHTRRDKCAYVGGM